MGVGGNYNRVNNLKKKKKLMWGKLSDTEMKLELYVKDGIIFIIKWYTHIIKVSVPL